MAIPTTHEDTAATDLACPEEGRNKPTLLLHVGPGKTGTSAIQAWLSSIADDLIPHGILYPAPIKEIGEFNGNGQDLGALLHRPHGEYRIDAPLEFEDMLSAYATAATEKNCHTVLLSSEFLSDAPRENLELLRECAATYFELRCIGFVRDPYWWLWSAWGQSVKRGGLSEDFESYARKNISYYSNILCAVTSLFGDTRLLAYQHKTLLEDFSCAAGIPKELLRGAPEARINRSLDKDELETLLAVNRIFGDAALSTRISDQMLSKWPNSKPYKYFSASIATEIRETNAPTLASLKHLIVNSDNPGIDARNDTVEIEEALSMASSRMDFDLLHIVLSAIAAWQEENSPLPRLRRLANEPAREAALKGILPEGFNSIEYLLINPDVMAAQADPVSHYLSYGRDEGRHYRRPVRSEESASQTDKDS